MHLVSVGSVSTEGIEVGAVEIGRFERLGKEIGVFFIPTEHLVLFSAGTG
jgi:hypothetical protein